jgi:hypothetical protein
VAVEAWWLWLGYGFVSRHFQLFEFDPSTSARGIAGGLPGVDLGANMSRVGALLMLVLAAVGFFRRVRAGRWDGVAAVLALSPVLVLLFQSYGGEGALRVYLFALPWLGLFAAAACLPGRRSGLRIVAATAAVGACTLFGLFGQEPLNYITPGDVAASRWTLDHAPAGATFTLAAPNFPERVDARYAQHLDETRDLLQVPGMSAFLRGERRTMPDVLKFLRSDGAASHFLILSPSQERYLRYHDISSGGGYLRLMAALEASPDLRLVYSSGGARVFELAPSLVPRASLDRNRGAA